MKKWPEEIVMIRHGESRYNAQDRESVSGYSEFVEQYQKEFETLTPAMLASGKFPSKTLIKLAMKFQTNVEEKSKYVIRTSDYDTPLTEFGNYQSETTGRGLSSLIRVPSKIYVSPYLRTRQTLEGITRGWPELGKVPLMVDERIREQEHGVRAIYADQRVYSVFNPQYALLRKLSTEYEYRHEGGESLLDVRQRIRGFVVTVIREHGGLPGTLKDHLIDLVQSRYRVAGKVFDTLGISADTTPEGVLLVTHHLTILAMRANFERWDRDKFIGANKLENRPKNASITVYRSTKTGKHRYRQGKGVRLNLEHNGITLY